MQKEITERCLVPNELGIIPEIGWARQENFIFKKDYIKNSFMKIKEWDNYIFTNNEFAISFTVADLGYAGALCVEFADFGKKKEHNETEIVLFPMHKKFGLGEDAKTSTGEWHTRNLDIIFKIPTQGKKRIICNYKNFYQGENLFADLDIDDPDTDSISFLTKSVTNKNEYFLNCKKNGLKATGTVTIGDRNITLEPETCFGCYNFCRGCFGYNNKTYWATGSGKLYGEDFGFNLGYRLFEDEEVTENAFFYGGEIHKLNKIGFVIPNGPDGKPDYSGTWAVASNDGRFSGEFKPIVVRSTVMDVKVLVSDQHQAFGRMTGFAVLEDGEKLVFKDFICSMEVIRNKC